MMWYILTISLAILPVIWKSSSLGKKWIKFSIYIAVCFAVTLLIPIWLLRPKDSRNALFPAIGYRKLSKFLGLKFSIEGQEHIVRGSGSVVLINHQSILDLIVAFDIHLPVEMSPNTRGMSVHCLFCDCDFIVLSYLWPLLPKCTVISKKEMLYYVPIGLACWLCGAIFIDRSKPSNAQRVVNKTGEIIRKSESRVLIFPEGTRNDGPKLVPFKKGAFHLAVASQCPIQPVAVSRFTFLGPNKFESGEIKIRILPAIPTTNCKTEDIPRLMEEAYETMSKNVDELSNTSK